MSIKLGSFADLCDDYSLMQIVDNTDNGRCSSCGECCCRSPTSRKGGYTFISRLTILKSSVMYIQR